MSGFQDFDLDLKKVSETERRYGITDLLTDLSRFSVNHCNEPSVTPPTTGMTVGCCKKANAAEPRCV